MIVIVFLISATVKNAISECGSVRGKVCCAGSYWNNEKSTCEKCPLGYHSSNCSKRCIYPSYGDDCQSICICNSSQCDYRYGCKEHTYVTDVTNKEGFTTTLLITESTSSGETLVITRSLPYFFLYIIIASIAIFLILCALCVGIFIHKQCARQATMPKRKEHEDAANERAIYSSLGVDDNQQNDLSRDETYLDPVVSFRPHYDDVNEAI